MFMKIAAACFALYCVHGAQNTVRDGTVLAEQGTNLARAASAGAPQAALAFCLENQSLCTRAIRGAAHEDTTTPAKAAALHPAEAYPLPPRRPATLKKA
jgi:hypothetical protein